MCNNTKCSNTLEQSSVREVTTTRNDLNQIRSKTTQRQRSQKATCGILPICGLMLSCLAQIVASSHEYELFTQSGEYYDEQRGPFQARWKPENKTRYDKECLQVGIRWNVHNGGHGCYPGVILEIMSNGKLKIKYFDPNEIKVEIFAPSRSDISPSCKTNFHSDQSQWGMPKFAPGSATRPEQCGSQMDEGGARKRLLKKASKEEVSPNEITRSSHSFITTIEEYKAGRNGEYESLGSFYEDTKQPQYNTDGRLLYEEGTEVAVEEFGEWYNGVIVDDSDRSVFKVQYQVKLETDKYSIRILKFQKSNPGPRFEASWSRWPRE